MKTNLVRVVVLLDRSGSMEKLVEATVSGVNEFVKSLKSESGDVNLKVVRFDSIGYETVWDEPLEKVPVMTEEMFVPRGGTPLLDSMARTITELGQELSKIAEDQRPGKVIVMTMTDGLENASDEFNLYTGGQERLAAMIKEQTEKYNWTFLYMGANQDAIAVGAAMGIPKAASVTYAANPRAARATYQNMGRAVNSVRSASARGMSNFVPEFTDEERERSIQPDPATTGTSSGASPFGNRH
jgi:uncharacterized protein YegL